MTAAAPLRVLVVEDEALLAMDIETVVEEEGHRVVGEAACAKSAEALPDEIRPDLAFVDVQLARGTSGLDVGRMIRRRWPDAVVIFVTANSRLIPRDEGEFGIIMKPFSHVGLGAALRYLGEGICDPPPISARPDVLETSPALHERFAH